MNISKLTITIIILLNITLGQELTSGLLERIQVDDKYKWDTSDIYENEQDWHTDFVWIEQNLSQYDQYRGQLSTSAKSLYDCLKFDEKIKTKLSYLWLYAKLNKDVDMQDEHYQQLWSKYQSLESQVDIARSFIVPEIIFIPGNKINDFKKRKNELIVYNHLFNSLLIKKDHTLNKDQEEQLIKVSRLIDNSYDLFGKFVYSELPFPIIKDDNHNDIQLNRRTSWEARASNDREYREKGYNEYYYSLGDFKGTLTKNLNNFIDGKIFLANEKNYESALEASLARDNIPIVAYENLIESLNKNLKTFHRWIKIKKEYFALDTLYIYDTRASMFPEFERSYTWEDAQDLVFESLSVMGEEYLENIRDAYDNRWIDAYPNVGKETGGYSSGSGGPHPYVKMNWGGKLFDFYTLVHELGHYVHATKSMESQPYIYANYPPFLAEVASTTAEMVSQFYLIDNAQSKEEKSYHIEKYLDNVFLYLHSSAMMAEFELMMYNKVEAGESLTAEDLCNAYGTLASKYYGKDITITEADKYSWLEWPHYYLDYYLFSYGTSFSASLQIASDILNEGEPAIQRFNDFLETGSSDYPINLLKKSGVDLTSSEPYDAVANKMDELMDEYLILIND